MADPTRNEPEPLWTAEDVAAFLGIHVQTVYTKARAGVLPSLKVGGARRFRRSDIEAWLEKHATTAPTPAAADVG